MKKLILFAMLLLAVSVNAQVLLLDASPKTVTNTVGYTKVFNMPLETPATQTFAVHLDSISGNHTNVLVTLWGQKSASVNSDSTSIGTINWKGKTADTTAFIVNATANRYAKYKVTYKGTGTGVTRVMWQELRLFRE